MLVRYLFWQSMMVHSLQCLHLEPVSYTHLDVYKRQEEDMLERISDYHENDIAEAFELLSEAERKRWYRMFGPEQIAEIFSYIDDPDSYLKELPLDEAAKVLSYMDADDAAYILDEMDDSTQEKLVGLLDEESGHDIKMILSRCV